MIRSIAALLLFCGVSQATSIVVTSIDTSRGTNFWLNADGKDEKEWAGVLNIQIDGEFNRIALCADLFTGISLNTTYKSTLAHTDAIANGARVAWLIDNWLPIGTESDAALRGAGLQLAIWDIVADGGDGFDVGRVRKATSYTTNSTILSYATQMRLSSVGQANLDAYVYKNVNIQGTKMAQTLVGPRYDDGGPTPNPEPGTMLMMGAGVLVFAWRRYKA